MSDPESSQSLQHNNEDWEMKRLLGHAAANIPAECLDTGKKKKTWKTYAKIILPHIGLIIISTVYVVGGALIFYCLEGPHEINLRSKSIANITSHKISILESLWSESEELSEEEWKAKARNSVEAITEVLFNAFESSFVTADAINNGTSHGKTEHWTITAAIFFTTTLLTTIGYGNLVPKTFYGRLFCILYGLLGVPLILITVADLGKFLSEHIVWLYLKCQEIQKRHRLCFWRRSAKQKDKKMQNNNLETQFDPDFALYDYVAIPVSLVLLILIGYTALGALIISIVEGWTFLNAFYFSFITMTTVGFGDLVPRQESYLLLNLLYIVVGLAITTMCIDLVGIQYIRKIHYFGRAISEARYALVNVGGKMIHVGDLMKYAQLLHRKYAVGEKDAAHVIDNPLASLFPDSFIPDDVHFIRFIDYIPGSHESLYNTLQQHLLKQQAEEARKLQTLYEVSSEITSKANATITTKLLSSHNQRNESADEEEPTWSSTTTPSENSDDDTGDAFSSGDL